MAKSFKGWVVGWVIGALTRPEVRETVAEVVASPRPGFVHLRLQRKALGRLRDERLEATFAASESVGLGLDLLVCGLDALGGIDHTGEAGLDAAAREQVRLASVAAYLLAVLARITPGATREEALDGIIIGLDDYLPGLGATEREIAKRAVDLIWGPR